MTNVVTIMQKELKSYLISPVFYFMAFFFLVLSGASFYFIVSRPVPAELKNIFVLMVNLLIFLCPLLTMHLFADERRTGTVELLMTYPLRDWEVVLGKYLASFALFLVLVLCTIEFPLFLYAYGKPDFGPIITGYLGFILLGASFLAVGMLGTSLARSQMLATGISFSIILGLMIFGYAGRFLGGGSFSQLFEYLPGTAHFANFAQGLIDTRDLIFFASFIFFSLFTAIRVVEINRWK